MPELNRPIAIALGLTMGAASVALVVLARRGIGRIGIGPRY